MGQRQAGQDQAGQSGMGQSGMGQSGLGQSGMGQSGQGDWPEQQAGGAYAESGQQRQFDQTSGQMGGGNFGDQIREHMRIVDADGNEVGTVDSCDGGQIKLTRRDSADGQHHYLGMEQVESVDGETVRLRADGNSLNDSGFGQGV